MRMNASQAQAAYGTPKMTVRRWIRAGKLKADEDGYFEEEDFLVLDAIRATQSAPGRSAQKMEKAEKEAEPKKRSAVSGGAKKKASAKKATPKKKSAAKTATTKTIGKPALPSGSGGITGPSMLPQSRQEVDLRKALANARKAEMEVKIKMKDLISRELVSRVFRKLYTIDSTEWRGLGPKLAPDIIALCEVEDPTKEVEVSDRIEREVFRTLGHVQRVLNEFLEEIESEDRVDDE